MLLVEVIFQKIEFYLIIFNSFLKNKKLILRSPNSIRPWQHVLDPIVWLSFIINEIVQKAKISNLNSFNFGPKKFR
jgi:CDP-glucose 4,6-dehydratase